MTKIVYNACYGGFGLSHAAVMRYAEIKGLTVYPEKHKRYPDSEIFGLTYYLVPPEQRTPSRDADWNTLSMEERQALNAAHKVEQLYDRDIDRADPALAQVVEELGVDASSKLAKLRIAEVPSGQRYRIDEYDGNESVMTVDDYEWSIA